MAAAASFTTRSFSSRSTPTPSGYSTPLSSFYSRSRAPSLEQSLYTTKLPVGPGSPPASPAPTASTSTSRAAERSPPSAFPASGLAYGTPVHRAHRTTSGAPKPTIQSCGRGGLGNILRPTKYAKPTTRSSSRSSGSKSTSSGRDTILIIAPRPEDDTLSISSAISGMNNYARSTRTCSTTSSGAVSLAASGSVISIPRTISSVHAPSLRSCASASALGGGGSGAPALHSLPEDTGCSPTTLSYLRPYNSNANYDPSSCSPISESSADGWQAGTTGSGGSSPTSLYDVDAQRALALTMGREIKGATNNPRMRTGRGGLGTFKKIVESQKVGRDAALHPATAELMASHDHVRDMQERAILERSKEDSQMLSVTGRGGRGNIVNKTKLNSMRRSQSVGRNISFNLGRRRRSSSVSSIPPVPQIDRDMENAATPIAVEFPAKSQRSRSKSAFRPSSRPRSIRHPQPAPRLSRQRSRSPSLTRSVHTVSKKKRGLKELLKKVVGNGRKNVPQVRVDLLEEMAPPMAAPQELVSCCPSNKPAEHDAEQYEMEEIGDVTINIERGDNAGEASTLDFDAEFDYDAEEADVIDPTISLPPSPTRMRSMQALQASPPSSFDHRSHIVHHSLPPTSVPAPASPLPPPPPPPQFLRLPDDFPSRALTAAGVRAQAGRQARVGAVRQMVLA